MLNYKVKRRLWIVCGIVSAICALTYPATALAIIYPNIVKFIKYYNPEASPAGTDFVAMLTCVMSFLLLAGIAIFAAIDTFCND